MELKGTEGSGAGCSLHGGAYWLLPKANTQQFRLILAAWLAGKSVRLRKVDEGTCAIQYVTTDGN